MNPTLIKIFTNSALYLVIGIVIGFFIALYNLDNLVIEDDDIIVEDGALIGDGIVHYVKLPHVENLIRIEIEEDLGLDHIIVLDKIKYKISRIEHNVGGHTIIHLSNTHDPIFS